MLSFAGTEETHAVLRTNKGEKHSATFGVHAQDQVEQIRESYYFVSCPRIQEKVEISCKPAQSPHCDDLYKAEDMSPVAALWEIVFPNHFHF